MYAISEHGLQIEMGVCGFCDKRPDGRMIMTGHKGCLNGGKKTDYTFKYA